MVQVEIGTIGVSLLEAPTWTALAYAPTARVYIAVGIHIHLCFADLAERANNYLIRHMTLFKENKVWASVWYGGFFALFP